MRTLALAALLLPLSFTTAADADAVNARLDKARTVYASEMANYRKRGHQWFDDREDAARARGNKKLVDQVKADRKHFEQTDELPKGAPRDMAERAAFARSKITRAYRIAIADSTKASRDKDAARLERELKFVQIGADPTDRRWRWVHEKGEYRMIGRGVWEELVGDGGKIRWSEVTRDAQFVELHVLIDGTTHRARLGGKSADYRIGSAEEFRPSYQGGWEP